MDAIGQQESPLSIGANITGILTFVVAIAAAIYARVTYLRNSGDEYFRVKTSLSWYKTESTWLADLVTAINAQHESFHNYQPEYQMYNFVMDDLLNLEQRILDLVADTETKASIVEDGKKWTLVPRSWQGGLQFMQMSMISSRLRDLESRTKWREMKMDESSRKLEALVENQRDRIRRLEDLVSRLMHPDQLSLSRTGTLNSFSIKRSESGDLADEDSLTVRGPLEPGPAKPLEQ
ncbi:hypothetical protein G7Z17_g5173 [Cylindrodendrum hubeiense]|uniref:Uncharacterized protein n=1 Tax=Cylindrodendrum hubeiense TaxID=595255 RepID=A0A9P5LBZ0_9HYPO|nr:hypothetical protein G7Z17_g5173 [Cylindrodendrum hubeiense]